MTPASRRVLIPDLDALPAPSAGASFYLQWSGGAMGTTWRVQAIGDALAAARRTIIGEGIAARIQTVVSQMSHFEPDSDLSRYNRAPAHSWVVVPEEFFEVLRSAVEIAAASGGWFDPTLGGAVRRWGFGPPGAHLPQPVPPAAAARTRGFLRLRLDESRRAVWQPGAAELNLGAIAKGFAADQATAWMRACGVSAALVEIGGELCGFGVKPDGAPWWVELENPPGAHSRLPLTVIALCGLSVAASGVWVRRRPAGRERIHHLIDPRTAAPARAGTLGAVVVHGHCMCADAWATALSVAPPEEAMRLAIEHGLAARLLFSQDGEIQEWLSPPLEAMAR